MSEAEIHAAVTDAWIVSDPVSLALTRETRVPDGAGGYTDTEVNLPPQTFRMDRSTNQSVQFVTAITGVSVPLRFRLVGQPDADIQDGDRFTIEGVDFEVTLVHRESFGRTAAEVERRG